MSASTTRAQSDSGSARSPASIAAPRLNRRPWSCIAVVTTACTPSALHRSPGPPVGRGRDDDQVVDRPQHVRQRDFQEVGVIDADGDGFNSQGQVLFVTALPIAFVVRPVVPGLASISVPISEQSVSSIAKTACASRSRLIVRRVRHRVAAVEIGDHLAQVPEDVLEVAVLGRPGAARAACCGRCRCESVYVKPVVLTVGGCVEA